MKENWRGVNEKQKQKQDEEAAEIYKEKTELVEEQGKEKGRDQKKK